MHALVHDRKDRTDETLLEDMQAMLKNRFNISHSTIQFEKNSCGENNVLCGMKH
jgi:Co/Zn/Cd efflux system component